MQYLIDLYLIFHLLGIAKFSSTFQINVGLKIDQMALRFVLHYLRLYFCIPWEWDQTFIPDFLETTAFIDVVAEPWDKPGLSAGLHDMLKSKWEGTEHKVADFFAGAGCSSRQDCGG